MARRGREKSIAALVMLDGVQATILIVVLPFTIFGSAHDLASGIVGVTPVGAGFALGILGTFIVGRQVDNRSALTTLQFLQVFQALCVIGTVVSALSEHFLVLGLCGMLALATSRSVGPAKDKRRSGFISPERRTTFNAQVRRYFLVANEAVGALCTITMSVIPSRFWPLLLLISLFCVSASTTVAGSLKKESVLKNVESAALPQEIEEGMRPQLAIGLLVVGLLGITSTLPTVGLSAWISTSHVYGPWFVTVVGLVKLVVDFFFIRFLSTSLEKRPKLWQVLHRFGGVLVICSVLGTTVAVSAERFVVQVPIILIAMVCSTLAYSVSTVLAMEVQFGFGSQEVRGRIASYTRLSSVAALALASWMAPGVFLGSWATVVAMSIVGAALCMLPGRLASAWTSLANSARA